LTPVAMAFFINAFRALKNTSAAEHLDVSQFPSDILWILTSSGGSQGVERLVIISPYEAQELMPQMKTSKHVFLHVYAPRPNLALLPLDELKLYTFPHLGADWRLPRYLRLQLNLFAGQLYFDSFDDYTETCEQMSLAWKPAEEGMTVEADGFIAREPNDPRARFRQSPVAFLKVLLTKLRRDSEEIDKTHWGKILGGEILREVDL
ncbi:hypothetical protein EDB80DRAFT_550749, partial [Ilyonectria destructans]